MSKTISKNTEELIPYSERSVIQSGIEITEEVLESINKLTLSPISAEDVVAYPVMLIDDRVTRNNTQYPKEFQKMLLSLPIGEGSVIGAPMLLGTTEDHQANAACQLGRIYEAEQVVDKEGHYGILGHMYMLKAGNKETLNKIDSGILKEVSISTKVEMPICSICQQDIRTCGHKVGQESCHVTMTGKGFCAEVSLVAIPGSSSAKILRAGAENDYKTVNEVLLMENLTSMKEDIAKIYKAIPLMIADSFKEFGSSLIPASGVPAPEPVVEPVVEPEPEPVVDKEKEEMQATIESLTSEISTVKLAKESLDSFVSNEKEKLIEETIKLGVISENIKFDKKGDSKVLFDNMSVEQLALVKDSFNKEATKMYPKLNIEVAPIIEEVIDKKDKKNKSTVNIMDFKNK